MSEVNKNEQTEQPKPMTLKQADQQIAEWATKLQTAQQALQQHEARIGDLALTGGVAAATQELTRLQTEVKVAEQAIAAAQRQRVEVSRSERSKWAKKLRAEADEEEKQANEHKQIIEEMQPKIDQAWAQWRYLSHQVSAKRRQAEEMERRLLEEQDKQVDTSSSSRMSLPPQPLVKDWMPAMAPEYHRGL